MSLDFENNKFLDENKFIIERLCNLKSLNVLENTTDMKLISNLTPSGPISFKKDKDMDFGIQISKLNKDLASLEKSLKLTNSKLTNKGFLESAPEDIVSEEKHKKSTFSSSIEDIKGLILQLKN